MYVRNFRYLPTTLPKALETFSDLATFHSLTVLSSEPDAIHWPSGEKATALTQREWPRSVFSRPPVVASHNLTVQSREPDAIHWPSGEKATALTQREWPRSVF